MYVRVTSALAAATPLTLVSCAQAQSFHQRDSCMLPNAAHQFDGDGRRETICASQLHMSASMAVHGLCRGIRFIWHRPNGVHRCPADSGYKRRDHQFLRIARDSCGSLCWRIRLRHWVVPLKCKYGEAPARSWLRED